MRICLISKYPPIQGGVSSLNYWQAKKLGELGHKIYITTNAWEVEEEYRQEIPDSELKYYQPKNVEVFSLDPKTRISYIPYARPDIATLTSLVISTIKRYDIDILDTWYLLPYSIVGFICKKITGKPLIVKHANSDISILLKSPYLHALFLEVLKNSDKIGTNPGQIKKILDFGIPSERTFLHDTSVDTDSFNPNVKPMDLSKQIGLEKEDTPIFTCIGKIHDHKGVYEFVKAASKIRDENFVILFVAGGIGLKKLHSLTSEYKLKEKSFFMKLQPPWRIPSILAASTCVVTAEHGYPVAGHTPHVAKEAMASGRCFIISEEVSHAHPFSQMQNDINSLVINPKNTQEFSEVLRKIIKNPDHANEIGKEARKVSEKVERFKEGISERVKIYEELIE